MFPDECQVLTPEVHRHLQARWSLWFDQTRCVDGVSMADQECLSSGRVSRRPDPLRMQACKLMMVCRSDSPSVPSISSELPHIPNSAAIYTCKPQKGSKPWALGEGVSKPCMQAGEQNVLRNMEPAPGRAAHRWS
ncbi:unnamed protein product [Symbiodinium natans]|uniref:Uncharacterized protein n=1 Tax=Symbiodinium natans TaxID=878477 RepID=A0A812TRP4_9DINO|nr:unnamed protein product [Symbiodinium natans]